MNLYKLIHEVVVGVLLSILVLTAFGIVRLMNITTMPGRFYALPLATIAVGGFLTWKTIRRPRRWGIVAALFLFLVAALLVVLSLALFLTTDLKDFLGAAASTTFGIVYIGLNMSWLLPLRFSNPVTGQKMIFLLFLVVACGDTLAFFGGRALGRTRLFLRVSPKKTVEGSLIGFVGSLLAAGIYSRWGWPSASLAKMLLIAGCLAVAEQVGDLVESGLKRGANVKD